MTIMDIQGLRNRWDAEARRGIVRRLGCPGLKIDGK